MEKISEDSTNYNCSCLIKFGICNIRNHYNKVLIVQIECIYGPVFVVVGVKKKWQPKDERKGHCEGGYFKSSPCRGMKIRIMQGLINR